MTCETHGTDECVCRGARYWMDRAIASEGKLNHASALTLELRTEVRALQGKLDAAQKALDASERMLGIWRDAEAKRREGYHHEIRLDDDGAIDEIVGAGAFHIEQMDTNVWFMEVGGCAFFVRGKAVKLNPRDYDNWQDAKREAEAPKS